MTQEWLVSNPAGAIVNGKRFVRGDVLTGDDADAVSKSRLLQHRCTRKRPSAQAAPTPPGRSAAAPAAGKE